MLILGIESSCDDTAVAIVDSDRNILSNLVSSQIAQHAKFGGVVPEIAARSHIEVLPLLFKQALLEANVTAHQLDAVAVTAGPGLIGGVIVGMMFAKGIAAVAHKPFIPVNHLEGHALTIRLTHDISFPYLLVLVSGGHTQILIVEGAGQYQLLATTIDDAIGETFDKTARMLGAGHPGGPIIEQLALKGDPHSFTLPKPLCNSKSASNFSFSGLKTAVKQIVDRHVLTNQFQADIAASLQYTVTEILIYKLEQSLAIFSERHPCAKHVVIAGGVASNQYIRSHLQTHLLNKGFEFIAPPPALCTDNAAMIAWAGIERFYMGYAASLDFAPRARWPL
jgi:N6-L-threonylcarbamoyladenine synthase